MASEGSSSPAEAELVEAEEMVGVVEVPWLLPEVVEIGKEQPHWVSEHEHWSSDDVVGHVDQLAGVVVDCNGVVEVVEIPASFDDVAADSSGSYYAVVGADSVGSDDDCCDGVEVDSDVVGAGDDELDSVAVAEVGVADVGM